MSKIDLIIEAIRLAEYHVKAKGWGDDIDLELYTEALAAARELRELKPVAWMTRRTGDGGVVLSGYETCKPTDYDAIPVYTTLHSAKGSADLAKTFGKPEQEPVAWKYDWYGHKSEKEPRVLVKDWIASVYAEVSDPTINAHNIRPLYAAPPKREWVGLTEDEIKKIMQRWRNGYIDIKDVEQLLKELNT